MSMYDANGFTKEIEKVETITFFQKVETIMGALLKVSYISKSVKIICLTAITSGMDGSSSRNHRIPETITKKALSVLFKT